MRRAGQVEAVLDEPKHLARMGIVVTVGVQVGTARDHRAGLESGRPKRIVAVLLGCCPAALGRITTRRRLALQSATPPDAARTPASTCRLKRAPALARAAWRRPKPCSRIILKPLKRQRCLSR